jgi:thioredoxin reductase
MLRSLGISWATCTFVLASLQLVGFAMSGPTPKTYDVLIVGGGAAGSSAAQTLVRQRHTVKVFDTQKYRFDPSYILHGLTAADGLTPKQYISKLHSELGAYVDYSVSNVEIVKIEKVDTLFQATDKAGETYLGRKVILAQGVSHTFPAVEGYEAAWGKGM